MLISWAEPVNPSFVPSNSMRNLFNCEVPSRMNKLLYRILGTYFEKVGMQLRTKFGTKPRITMPIKLTFARMTY